MSEKIDEIESFEDKVKKLESLLEKLKDENLSLEKSVEIYKEALNIIMLEIKNSIKNTIYK